eukprot:56463_1
MEEDVIQEVDLNDEDDTKDVIQVDNEMEEDDEEEEEEVDEIVQSQMGHRGSMELKIDQEANPLEQEFKIEPSPKHKPMIPPSSDLKPIGHQKSEQEIMAEVQQEQKQQISSLRPLKSAESMLEDTEDTEDTDEVKEENEEEIDGNKVDDEEGEDEVSQSPLEIENEVEEEEEEEKENDVNHLDIRDLGALDPNDSAISENSVAIKSETGESHSSAQEETLVTTNTKMNTDIIDENSETRDDV